MTMRNGRHIIAIGGGGLSRQPDYLALERYILAQTGRTTPKIAFLGTATGDADAATVRFYDACSTLPCRPTHVSLYRRTPDLRAALLNQDVIYVGGGNTRSMLAAWREWDLPALLHEAWQEGIVLAGVSAGAICWFEQGVTDSWADRLRAMDCLGFLPGSCCPHYSGEAERRPAYTRMIGDQEIGAGLAIDDGAAVHFAGMNLHAAIAARPGAQVYRVDLLDGTVQHTALEMQYL
jgi:dipeptidase E